MNQKSRASSALVLSAAVLLILLAAGCNHAPSRVLKPPKLEIAEPLSGLVTPSSSVIIRGATDQSEVWVRNMPLPVKNGTFYAEYQLTPGQNEIIVEAGNAVGTTTMPLLVTRRSP